MGPCGVSAPSSGLWLQPQSRMGPRGLTCLSPFLSRSLEHQLPALESPPGSSAGPGAATPARGMEMDMLINLMKVTAFTMTNCS